MCPAEAPSGAGRAAPGSGPRLSRTSEEQPSEPSDASDEHALPQAELPGDAGEDLELVAFVDESGSVSKMALVRCQPLDSVTDEHTTLRGSGASMPTLQIEAAAALAASPPPAASPPVDDSESDTATSTDTATAPESEMRAMPTPLVMVGPATADLDAPESGVTRIEPVERRSRFRTPIPMPFSIPPPYPRESRGRSFLKLAALVVAPPLIVMLGIFGMRAAADARMGHRAAAMEVVATAPPPAEPVPVAVPVTTADTRAAPPVAAPQPPPLVEPAADAKPKSGARPRPPRPGHHPPHAGRPAPVAVSR